MASNLKTKSSSTNQKNIKSNEKSIYQKFENFFEKNLTYIFIISLFLTIFLSLLVFNIRIHEGGDDSGYIEMGYNFIKGKSFPTWHGELYSIFLGILIGIFGLNVFILKLSSLIFVTLQIIFIYLAFKNRISSIIIAFTLLITSTCYNILFHASQTYSEAIYMFFQPLLIFVIFKYFLNDDKLNSQKKLTIINYLIVGLLLFVCYNLRNIGISFTIALLIFLILEKRFINVLYTTISFVFFNFLYHLYKKLIWHTTSLSFIDQLKPIFYKDYYNPSAGKENLLGLLTRFYENIKIYLSYHIMSSIGLQNPDNVTYRIIPAIIIYAILFFALIHSFKKNKYIFFLSLYTLIAVSATFIVLHHIWSQNRLIIIYLPYILILIFYGLFELSKIKKLKIIFYVTIIISTIAFIKTTNFTLKIAQKNSTIIRKNLSGNKYYGFTPDWENFLKMSEWVSKNIPDTIKVASRKPSMSFIYGNGREFFPIYKIPTIDSQILIKELKQNDKNIVSFNFLEFSRKNFPLEKNIFIRSFIKYLIENDSLLYGVAVPEYYFNEYINILNENNIKYITSSDSLINFFKEMNQPFYGLSPDDLLMNLRKNNVGYLILASLRINPNEKTDRIINTVHRYVYFIECKYPGIFSVVHQIGDANNEPAILVKVNYKLYDLINH